MRRKGRKQFFFEKKNQKTFANGCERAFQRGQVGAARNFFKKELLP
jgi:hypothetical protein